jgi:hypothetical protein
MTGMEQLAIYATGPFLAACALLVVAGVTKLRGPQRLLGAAEIGIGLAGAGFGRAAAVLVAFTYLALAAYALRLLRVAPDKPCNCLGAKSAPVTAAHVGLDLGAALFATFGAFGPGPLTTIGEHPLAGIPFAVLVACCTWLGVLAIGAYPELRAAQREGSV